MSDSSALTTKDDEVVDNPDIHFEPIVKLAPVDVKTLEEEETELLKLRAKLFRYDYASDPPEWKERGTGEIKLLKHRTSGSVRLLMRRDKTHKICANHILTKEMKLVASGSSDRAWVWTVLADYADEEPKKEQLAIRFKTAEIAQRFKAEFELSQQQLQGSDSNLADDLSKLSVRDNKENQEKTATEEAKGASDGNEGDKVATSNGDASGADATSSSAGTASDAAIEPTDSTGTSKEEASAAVGDS